MNPKLLRKTISEVGAAALTSSRVQPHSIDAEEHLLSCCLIDGKETLAKCIQGNITPKSFYAPANRVIFETLLEMNATGKDIDLAVLAEELNGKKTLDEIGGMSYLIKVSSRVPSTAQAAYFIEKVREMHQLREIIVLAAGAIEKCYDYNGDGIAALNTELRTSLENIERGTPTSGLRGIATFSAPPDNDPNTLLGNRYVVRGDGGILSCSSGMGKSSMSIQMAITLSLGKAFFGIQPHGKLRSLIVQAEDSDGDVGEVVASVVDSMKLTDDEIAEVNECVVVKTERALRGERFFSALRGWIRQHKPDLVFINPLFAFVDGDVNESKDIGKFLREGLNAVNSPPSFAYIVVHHTTKPPTGKNTKERSWSEIMYDMAGSAELTNWARAIMSLRPKPTKGHFDLVLAKRGTRAGVVKEVQNQASTRTETVTTIPLKHAEGTVNVPGRARPMPRIFWEYRNEDDTQETPSSAPDKGGRPKNNEYSFATFADIFPTDPASGIGFRKLHRAANNVRPVSQTSFWRFIEETLSLGLIAKAMNKDGNACYYRPAKNTEKKP